MSQIKNWIHWKGNPHETTIAEASEWVMDNRDEGCICPTCHQCCKVYKRTMFSSMAVGLVKMFRLGAHKEFIRTSRIDNSGNIGKMRFLGLIQASDVRGYWRITPRGMLFLDRRIKVPKYFYTYNLDCIDIDDTQMIDIDDALGKKFDLNELMNG